MLVGHVAVAMLVKQVEPRLSFGTAILAATIADLLLFALVLLGIEHVQFRTSETAAPYFLPSQIAISHSLASTALAAALFAGIHVGRRGRGAGAWLLGAALVGHWVLDLLSYQPFLPLIPGRELYVGWSMTRGFVVAAVVEAVLWIGAVVLYVSESRSTSSAGRYVFWGGVLSWTYIGWANLAGPPRQSEEAPIEMLILLGMMIAWGYWMDRARAMKASPGGSFTNAAPSTY